MIRFTTGLLMLGIGTAMTTTAIAQDWWAGCNPHARWCRRLSGPQQRQAPRSFHRHAGYHHKAGHHSG
jgi:hypothetical protein